VVRDVTGFAARSDPEGGAKTALARQGWGPIEIVYRSEVAALDWAARALVTPLPGLWPYGLNSVPDVAGRPPLLSEVPGASIRRAHRPWLAPKEERGTFALTWDERTATALSQQRPGQRFASGLIWITDDWDAGRKRIRSLYFRAHLRRAQFLWVLCRPQVAAAHRLLGRGGPAVHFLRFGIDTEFFYYSSPPQAANPLFVSFGNDRDRDVPSLFEAMALVRQAAPSARCVVQTSSPITPPPGVEVIGHVPHEQLRTLYRECTAAVVATVPNLHVSGMTVALEAQATGRPIVISRTPGIDDYVRDGQTGKLTPPQDPRAQAAALLQLLASPQMSRDMGIRGREYVESNHSDRAMTAELGRLVDVHNPR
jgi:glycosyltransferase involved in cell wall biosynthesis